MRWHCPYQRLCNAICQTSALNMDEVVRRSRHAEANGADALMILPPYLEGPADEQGLFEFYREIDAEVDIDIVGYNILRQLDCPLRLRCSPSKRLEQLNDIVTAPGTGRASAASRRLFAERLRYHNCLLLDAGRSWPHLGGANYMPHEAAVLPPCG